MIEIKATWLTNNSQMVDDYAKIFKKFASTEPPKHGLKYSTPTHVVLHSSCRPTSKNSDLKTAAAALCEITSERVRSTFHKQVGYKEVQEIRNLLAIWIPVVTANTFPIKGKRANSTPWAFWDELDTDPSVGAGIAISSQDHQIDQLSMEKLKDEQYLDKAYSDLINNPRWSSVGVGVKGESVPDPIIAKLAHELFEVIHIFSYFFLNILIHFRQLPPE